jgi:signal transduction histidine kinase
MDRAAREVVTALDEIVWAVNPARDTLEGLGNYLSQYVTEALGAGKMRCRLEIPTLLPARFISSGTRHQLLMTAKEALNNAIKHSGASEIRVRLGFTEQLLTIAITDNGRGFDPQRPATRNGIANMNLRLRSVGGTCEIQSTPGHGTTVIFRVNLDLESPTH